MTVKIKLRCQLRWTQQANCQWAKGDNYPHSECLAPAGDYCRQRNAKPQKRIYH